MHTDPQGKVFMHVSVCECKRERLCNLSFVISVNSKFKMVKITLQKSEMALTMNYQYKLHSKFKIEFLNDLYTYRVYKHILKIFL